MKEYKKLWYIVNSKTNERSNGFDTERGAKIELMTNNDYVCADYYYIFEV